MIKLLHAFSIFSMGKTMYATSIHFHSLVAGPSSVGRKAPKCKEKQIRRSRGMQNPGHGCSNED